MARTTHGTTVAVATAGLIWSLIALCPVAAADPVTPASPGVPCLSMIQQLAATPPSPPEVAPDPTSTVAEAVAPPQPVVTASGSGTEASPQSLPVASIPPPADPADALPTTGPVAEWTPEGGMPTDLLCAGAAWALLSESSDGSPAEMPHVAPVRDRGQW